MKKILDKIKENRLIKDINNDKDFIGIALGDNNFKFLTQDKLDIGDILFFASRVDRR